MSQVAKPEGVEASNDQPVPQEKENHIELSAEAQRKLAALVLDPPATSPEIKRMQAIHDQLVRKSCE